MIAAQWDLMRYHLLSRNIAPIFCPHPNAFCLIQSVLAVFGHPNGNYNMLPPFTNQDHQVISQTIDQSVFYKKMSLIFERILFDYIILKL